MACACSKKAVRKTFVYVAPDGQKKVYNSEVEARAAVARKGGTYKVQG